MVNSSRPTHGCVTTCRVVTHKISMDGNRAERFGSGEADRAGARSAGRGRAFSTHGATHPALWPAAPAGSVRRGRPGTAGAPHGARSTARGPGAGVRKAVVIRPGNVPYDGL